jgi:DNA repair protein RadC
VTNRRIRTVQFVSEATDHGKADGPVTAAAIARKLFNEQWDWDREHFVVLGLNARGRVTSFKLIGIGTLTACLVHPREVFRAAIMLNAASIICVHNHPSGDLGLSDEDQVLHQRLVDSGELLGIPVLDSLIISQTDHRSLA